MAVGNIGENIIFEISDSKVLYFTSLKKTVSARWQKHERVGLKPKKQFGGPDDDTISMSIIFNAELGVKPRDMVEKLEKVIKNGTPEEIVIGNKPLGENQFVITKMDESYDRILNKGEVVKITVDIELEEYI